MVYSARPKGRLWEVGQCEYLFISLFSSFQADIAGTVISTVKQRDLVTAPPTVIIDVTSSDLPLTPPMPSLPTFNFDRLILLLNTYLVTWREGSIFIFHPSSYSLSSWSNQFQGIVDVICVNEKVSHASILTVNCPFTTYVLSATDYLFVHSLFYLSICCIICPFFILFIHLLYHLSILYFFYLSILKVYILHNNCQSVTCLSYLKIFDTLKALMRADNSQLAKQVSIQLYNEV